MAGDKGAKTEKPTPRRLEKARREGNFASSKEFVGALQFSLFVALVSWYGPTSFENFKQSMRAVLQAAFSNDLHTTDLIPLIENAFQQSLTPFAIAGGALALSALAFQLASTGMGASIKKLSPSFKRFEPLSKIKNLPSQGIPAMIEAIVLLVIFGFFLWWLADRNAQMIFVLPLSSLEVGLRKAYSVCMEVLWKGAALLLVFGFVDLFRKKRRYMNEMRMSKQELRDELKESEGNPQIKLRIRRIQRDLRRRKMMAEVPTATAVIVNPTHYAVAIRYKHDIMPTPVVVAKGKNYLALRIRQCAIDHNVPLIENPPLAQALYKHVQVGQEIPPNFYRAIAEILAYVYRLMRVDMK